MPRNVRVTTLALYNFIITNISGLSTTLVPLLREYYAAPHVFEFSAEPLADTAYRAAASAIAASSMDGGHFGMVESASRSGLLLSRSELGSGSAGGGGLVNALGVLEGVEAGDMMDFKVLRTGSRGLQAAMFWMYPGMFLASSGEWFCEACTVICAD